MENINISSWYIKIFFFLNPLVSLLSAPVNILQSSEVRLWPLHENGDFFNPLLFVVVVVVLVIFFKVEEFNKNGLHSLILPKSLGFFIDYLLTFYYFVDVSFIS